MSGRHRLRSLSWRLPLAVGALAALGLAALVWLTGGVPGGDPVAAADHLALNPSKTAPPVVPSSTTAAPSTSTSSPAPSPSTSTPTRPKSTEPKATPTVKKPVTQPKSTATLEKTVPAAKACSSTLAGTQPNVAQVGNHILTKFTVSSVGGRAGRSGTSDHPSGLALDFMVDTSTGNALADYVLAHRGEFGVTYVIWRQRINMGSGWEAMEDRGSPTANHYDHVHVSFEAGAHVSVTC